MQKFHRSNQSFQLIKQPEPNIQQQKT